MSLYAIGDLHLPGGEDKSMSVFGPQWEDHMGRISAAWREMIAPEDTVLIPGDISWAMKMEDALPDLRTIAALPGKKVLIRGNHDYWWNSVSRIRAALEPGMYVLQHDAADMGDFVVCGTRGWMIPTGDTPLDPENEKIYRREGARLTLALDAAERIAEGRPIVVMIHYPPLYETERSSEFTRQMEERGVALCVYGHLHGTGIRAGFNGTHNGVMYRLTSCDSLGFRPLRLELPGGEDEREY